MADTYTSWFSPPLPRLTGGDWMNESEEKMFTTLYTYTRRGHFVRSTLMWLHDDDDDGEEWTINSFKPKVGIIRALTHKNTSRVSSKRTCVCVFSVKCENVSINRIEAQRSLLLLLEISLQVPSTAITGHRRLHHRSSIFSTNQSYPCVVVMVVATQRQSIAKWPPSRAHHLTHTHTERQTRKTIFCRLTAHLFTVGALSSHYQSYRLFLAALIIA